MSGHVYNGSTWERAKSMHLWNGSIFEEVKEAWWWNGSAFEKLYQKGIAWTDDFNRTTSATIGNGWTKYGSNSQISTNSYAFSGTTDGSGGIVSPTPISNNDGYVEVVLGGLNGPNSTSDCSLIGRMNTAGSSGISANIFSNKCYISVFSGSLTSPSFSDLANNSTTWASGDTARLEFEGSNYRLFKNGTSVLTATGSTNQGSSYRLGGLRVERSPISQNSSSFNSFKLADFGY